ncbi:hypothetical protein [Gallaecimonas sp. GXIMD4217]|uniref:hypothetical protein n=1 Tax=Gallaecimonas sp. GXIMD4217 TaxID=3131927 RepID=UPI00311ABBF1
MHKAKGQSSTEYLVICAALTAALLTPIGQENPRNVLQWCADELKEAYAAYANQQSLTQLPVL